jgi:hypothetical protein
LNANNFHETYLDTSFSVLILIKSFLATYNAQACGKPCNRVFKTFFSQRYSYNLSLELGQRALLRGDVITIKSIRWNARSGSRFLVEETSFFFYFPSSSRQLETKTLRSIGLLRARLDN